MIELPVPCCAAPEEMLTITPSPDCAQQRDKGPDRRERPAHIGGQHGVDQIVVERFEIVVRDHPGKAGGIDQDVGAAELVPDRGRNLADLRGVLQRQVHRLVAVAGQLGDQRRRAVGALVVADDDTRAPAAASSRTLAAPMPLLPPVTTATLPASEERFSVVMAMHPGAARRSRREAG